MKRQIFLDLDGPLLDNRDKYFGLVGSLLNNDVGSLTRDRYWEGKRDRLKESVILADLGLSEAQLTAYNQQRIASIETMPFLQQDRVWPWVPDILKRWRDESELFIVTMRKNRKALLQQLDFLGLTSFFDHILSEDQNCGDASVKVALVEPLRRDVPGFFVGDTEADIRAGKTLGLMTFGVTCGIRNQKQLSGEHPDHLVADLRDVERLLLGSGA